MENKKWAPSQEENLGVITSVYEFIKEELSELQKKLDVPIHLFMILLAKFRMNGILNLVTPQLEIKKEKLENIKSSTQINKISLILFEFKNFKS